MGEIIYEETTNMFGGKYRVPKVSPEYDSGRLYVSRRDRPEWQPVALVGQVRVRKGQVMASGWRKMRDVSDKVELWFIR